MKTKDFIDITNKHCVVTAPTHKSQEDGKFFGDSTKIQVSIDIIDSHTPTKSKMKINYSRRFNGEFFSARLRNDKDVA